MRRVLFIPKEEIHGHFAKNARQDMKVVAPNRLTDKLFEALKARGKEVKAERPLTGDVWKHSDVDEPNDLTESKDFVDGSLPQYAAGPFAVAFANERAGQDEHYHTKHLEIYFSEHPLTAEYRYLGDQETKTICLEQGGALVFGPDVVHRVRLGGLTIVVEVPAVADDRTVV
ncbi:MAG: hypothetical protein HY675_02225 [Chloroflexi bacterium]|nr:hypothetical protein [Chloroflexota bacterium]